MKRNPTIPTESGNSFLTDLSGTMPIIAMNWHVYIILCSDNSLYTGITTDIERRFNHHAAGRGARYFRGRQPIQVVYLETGHNRSSASKRESRIKALCRADKDLLVTRQTSRCCTGPLSSEISSRPTGG